MTTIEEELLVVQASDALMVGKEIECKGYLMTKSRPKLIPEPTSPRRSPRKRQKQGDLPTIFGVKDAIPGEKKGTSYSLKDVDVNEVNH